MNTTEFNKLMQLNFYVHNSLFPFLLNQDIVLTDKLRELIKAIEISEIDKFVRLKSKGFAEDPLQIASNSLEPLLLKPYLI